MCFNTKKEACANCRKLLFTTINDTIAVAVTAIIIANTITIIPHKSNGYYNSVYQRIFYIRLFI